MFSLPYHVIVLAGALIGAAHILMVGPTAASLGLPVWAAVPFLWLGSATTRWSQRTPGNRLVWAFKLASPLVVFAAFLYGTSWSTWVLGLTDFQPIHTGTIGLAMLPLFAPLLVAHLSVCTEPSGRAFLPTGNVLASTWSVRIPLSLWSLLLLLLAIGDLSSLTPELQAFLLVSPLGQACQLVGALILAGLLAPRALVWGMDLVPLEAHLRRRGEAMISAAGIRGVRLSEWRTDREISNAMVIGTPPFGWSIVFTDRLLDDLGQEEFEAVLAHELGHIRGRHVRHFLLWIMGALALTIALEASSFSVSFWLSVCGSLGALVALMVWMRFVSRRFELEADLLAAESKSDGLTRALSGLGQLFGTSHKNGFRHFSMSRRILFVRGNRTDPGVGERLKSTTNRIRKAGWVCLGVTTLLLVWAERDTKPRTEIVRAIQLGEFGHAAELFASLPEEQQGSLNESFPSLEHLLAVGGEGMPSRGFVTGEQLAQRAAQALERDEFPSAGIVVVDLLDLAILRSFGNAPGERHLRDALALALAGDGDAESALAEVALLPELEHPWREVAKGALRKIEEQPLEL